MGVFLYKEEADIIEALKKDDVFYIPLNSFVDLTGTTRVTDNGGQRIKTPLGDVTLHNEHIHSIDGIPYLDHTTIEKLFHITMEFHPEEFALLFDLPWRPKERD